jgi:hypothetical protein
MEVSSQGGGTQGTLQQGKSTGDVRATHRLYHTARPLQIGLNLFAIALTSRTQFFNDPSAQTLGRNDHFNGTHIQRPFHGVTPVISIPYFLLHLTTNPSLNLGPLLFSPYRTQFHF